MHPDAERISSYLDGELGPAERAEVEKLLVDDRAARELFADLRQQQAGLRGLPQHTLPQGFADEVMRAAERLMLLGPGDTELTPAAREAAEWTAPAPRAAARYLWRSPAWFVSGAAAAVLLMLAIGFFRNTEQPKVVNANGTDSVATSNGGTATRPRDRSTSVAESPQPDPGVAEPSEPTHQAPAPPPGDESIADDRAPSPQSPNDVTPEQTPEPAPVVPVRQRPPYGFVVWANVDVKVLQEGQFDQLLAEKKIAISNKVSPEVVEKGGDDVVYAEATMAHLDSVFMAMHGNNKVYRGTLMQYSLGVFHEPKLWSEILNAVNPVVDGSRAVHITPEVVPSRPLPLEQMTAEAIKHLEGDAAAMPFDAAMSEQSERPPTVDDGLVRAIFILHPQPAEADDAAPAQGDAPQTTP